MSDYYMYELERLYEKIIPLKKTEFKTEQIAGRVTRIVSNTFPPANNKSKKNNNKNKQF